MNHRRPRRAVSPPNPLAPLQSPSRPPSGPSQPTRALAALLATLPIAAGAQTPTPTTTVVIEAPRPTVVEPRSVDPATLRSLGAATSDTANLLRGIPGVSLQGAGGASSLPVIHGMASDRLRVKVDGMDLIASCPNHMNPPLSYLDPSAVAALEVWAGIAPVSAGGDSIGGTIVARTRDPEFAAAGQPPRVGGEAGVWLRSNGEGHGLNLSARYTTETLALSYSGALARSGNYDAGGDFKPATLVETGRPGHMLPLDEVGSTAYETRNHNLGLAWRAGEHLLDLRLGLQEVPEQLYPNQRMDMLKNDQQRVNLRYLGRFDWGRLEARVYDEQVDHFMDFGADKRFYYSPQKKNLPALDDCGPIGPNCAHGMPMFTKSGNTGLTLAAELPLAEGSLVRTGIEAQRYRLDDWWPASGAGMWPGTFLNIHDGERDRLALYGEWEARHGARWTTLAGVRVERVTTDAGDVTGYKTALLPDGSDPANQVAEAAAFNALDRERRDDNVDLTLLARYTASPTIDAEFGLARKARSPNLYERYTWSSWPMAGVMNNFVGDGNGYVGDPDLKPEVAHTASLGIDWHAEDRRWQLRATPYVTQVSDYIDAVKRAGWLPDQYNVLDYANQSARLWGVDVSGRMPLAEGRWGGWALEGVLSWVDGENRDTGDETYNLMPLNARLTLKHRLGGWHSALEWVLVDAKDDGSDVRNEVPTPGYGLVNLRTSRSWQRVRIELGIENLLDKRYALPTGGVYVGQGTTMSMNGVPWGIPVPGPGRSVHASMTVSF
jgi:iron complex outermembrane receptor protein